MLPSRKAAPTAYLRESVEDKPAHLPAAADAEEVGARAHLQVLGAIDEPFQNLASIHFNLFYAHEWHMKQITRVEERRKKRLARKEEAGGDDCGDGYEDEETGSEVEVDVHGRGRTGQDAATQEEEVEAAAAEEENLAREEALQYDPEVYNAGSAWRHLVLGNAFEAARRVQAVPRRAVAGKSWRWAQSS